MIYKKLFLLIFVAVLYSQTVFAELVVRITKGVDTSKGGIPIIIAPFAGGDLNRIIEADLRRSGRFDLISANTISQPLKLGLPLTEDTKQSNAEYIIVGRETPALNFEILSVHDGQRIAAFRLPMIAQHRRMAHKAADLIFDKLVGQRGAFDTKIAYISTTGSGNNKTYRLMVADADGHNAQMVLSSPKPVMSPTWSPDGRELAYVSFESEQAEIYIQDLNSGEKRKFSSRKGLNGAPAWSPNGNALAITLSESGNPEIYIQDINGRLKKLTNSPAIDTEPVFSANGKSIIFTSDRHGGKTQLYRVAITGGTAQRLTQGGRYHSAASVANGKLAMVRQVGNRFRIVVKNINAKKGGEVTVSKGYLDESPSLAPNGTMVLFATKSGNDNVLAVASDNGKAYQVLYSDSNDVRDPAWSPYLN